MNKVLAFLVLYLCTVPVFSDSEADHILRQMELSLNPSVYHGIFKMQTHYPDRPDPDLAALKDAVINVVIKIDNRTTLDALIRHINAKLAATPYRAYPWNHFAREMVQAVQADSGSFILFAIILLILSGANIVNVFSMSVQERTRELATLKAIGQKRKNLIWMILSEAMIQALIATVAGIAISAGFVWYISHVGIDIASYLPEDIPMPFGNRFYGDYRLYDFAYAGCFVILVSLLGAVIPARRAGRLVIADALREAR